MPAAYFLHTEAPRQVSRHSESGGRTWPAPPPKAIAHPFLWPLCAGRTWRPGLWAVIFGRGNARSLFLAHGGPSLCLAAFRVRRTDLASPTPQGYSPPVFVPFLRWTNLAPRPSAGYFWARLCPRIIFSTRRPLAKSRGIPSPADGVGQPHPPRLQPTRFCGLFPLDELGAPAFGRLYLGAALRVAYFWHTEAPRKVSRHSESG